MWRKKCSDTAGSVLDVKVALKNIHNSNMEKLIFEHLNRNYLGKKFEIVVDLSDLSTIKMVIEWSCMTKRAPSWNY